MNTSCPLSARASVLYWAAAACFASVLIPWELQADWPTAAGPGHDFQSEGTAPVEWSAERGEGILWRTELPDGGQSTPVIAGGRVFLTTHRPMTAEEVTASKGYGSDIEGHCLDAETGELLWSVEISSGFPMKMAGIFSDSTSPSPVTDDEHVWFFNAGGAMGCWTVDGTEVWRIDWERRTRHHSRQCEPILLEDTLLLVEVLTKDGADAGMHKNYPEGTEIKNYWTHLHARDKASGELLWTDEVGTAIHNTPTAGQLPDGRWAVLHGRGGGHGPLEKPYGLTLSDLSADNFGRAIWTHDLAKADSYFTSPWNESHVCWFDGKDHLVINSSDGELIARQSLETGRWCRYDKESGEYVLEENAKIPGGKRAITNMANILVGDYHYFLLFGHPSIGRIHLQTGAFEVLDLPPGPAENQPTNSRDIDITIADKRSLGTGFGHVSAASPIVVGSRLFFPTMRGLVYVIDLDAPQLDDSALLAINDLGIRGETWSLSSLAFSNGRLYARTMRELICIGE